ncbi:MAG TPA: hypothetical protein VFG99_01725, partial [Chloroflexia bacterium]|nr:hypothetical protein [Chloroflexia bacterium]
WCQATRPEVAAADTIHNGRESRRLHVRTARDNLQVITERGPVVSTARACPQLLWREQLR